jgi:hypothetical protein
MTSVRTGLLGEEMLLVAQALAGGAIEDPVLLPFVQHLEPFEQHDHAGGGAHEEGSRLFEPGNEAVFGEHRNEDGEHDDRDLGGLVGALIGLSLRVVPVDLALQPLP